jgi:hypothetical protein
MRDHPKPIQCLRCWEELPSVAAHEQHAIQTPACELNPRNPISGITDALWKEYKAKELKMCGGKRVSAARITHAARWKLLYKVVFPNETSIPSPCSSITTLPATPLTATDYQNQSKSPAARDLEHDAVFEEYEHLQREFMDTQLREEYGEIVDKIKRRMNDVMTGLFEQAKQNVRTGVTRGPAPDAPPLPVATTTTTTTTMTTVVLPPRLSFGGAYIPPLRQQQQHLPPTAPATATRAEFRADDVGLPGAKREPEATPPAPAPSPGAEAGFPRAGPVGGGAVALGVGPAGAKAIGPEASGAPALMPVLPPAMDFAPEQWTLGTFHMDMGPDLTSSDRLILDGTVMEDDSFGSLDEKDLFNSGHWNNAFPTTNFISDNS